MSIWSKACGATRRGWLGLGGVRCGLRLALALVTFIAAAPADAPAQQDPSWVVRSPAGMVATDSVEASRIGADVLAAGGNAFDAAVAVSFALSVARPESTGLGGGGFLLARVGQTKQMVALDFRETAPAGATAERFAERASRAPEGPSASVFGGDAIGVPGLVAGLAEINRRYGTRTFAQLARGAIELAESGFTIDASFLRAREKAGADFEKWPELKRQGKNLHSWLFATNESLKAGERLKNLPLARGLRKLAELGGRGFYEGPIAVDMARAAQAAGGTLTLEDLGAYHLKERQPLLGFFGPYDIYTMPPPSSGGIAMIETINIVESAGLRLDLPLPLFPHLLVEAFKHSFADRAKFLGDPDYCEIPARLINKAYASFLCARIRPDRAGSGEGYGGDAPPPEDKGTSHFCIADRSGNIVSMTETINSEFGSFVVSDEFGILLNNQMDDFLTVRGQANLYGLRQSENNLVAPGKRPLSSMTPTIVFEKDKPVLALGASGGPRIITAVTQVALHVLHFGRPLPDAVAAVRVHHQWMPDEVYFDRAPSEKLAEVLTRLGHTLGEARKEAAVQGIQFLEDGTFVGVSDPRKGGAPAAPSR